jgi:hypothetical protein
MRHVPDTPAPAQPRALPPKVKRLLLAVAAVAVVLCALNTVWRACYMTLERSDFPVFLAAGRAVIEGTDLYAARSARGWHYAYPPPFAILMVPFTLMPRPLASLTWYIASLALFAHALHLCVSSTTRCTSAWPDRFALYALPVLLLAWPLGSSLERGQSSLLMLWFTIVGVSCYRTSVFTAAAGLAGAILLRGFPVVLLAYFVCRRQWRLVGVTLLLTLLLGLGPPALVLGWEENLSYLERWLTEVTSPAMTLTAVPLQTAIHDDRYSPHAATNQALAAVLYRLSGSSTAPVLALAVGVLMVVASAITARRSGRDSEPLLIGQAFIWMLVIIPAARVHYFVHLLWPTVWLLVIAARSLPHRQRQTARIALAILAVSNALGGLWEPMRFYGPLCWAALAMWIALLPSPLTSKRLGG